MKLLKNLFILVLLMFVYTPSYAALHSMDSSTCGVFSDEKDKGGEQQEEAEEEPDCE